MIDPPDDEDYDEDDWEEHPPDREGLMDLETVGGAMDYEDLLIKEEETEDLECFESLVRKLLSDRQRVYWRVMPHVIRDPQFESAEVKTWCECKVTASIARIQSPEQTEYVMPDNDLPALIGFADRRD